VSSGEKLTNEAELIEDLGADSLDIVELVMEFERSSTSIFLTRRREAPYVGDALRYLKPERSELKKRRVVVTGMGASPPSGTMWRRLAALIEGKSGPRLSPN